MQYLYYIYIIVVTLCLLRSVIRKDVLYIYFLVVLLVDLYMYFFFKKTQWNIHPYAIVFYMCFFIYYYKALFSNKRIIYYITFFLVFLIGILLALSSENPYGTPLIVLMSLVYILLPLLWFIKEIVTVNEQKITDKQRFWISTGLLFWIIFFIFKMVPLYFFNKQDLEFLLVLDNIYQIATIISYLIFFKSLYHK